LKKVISLILLFVSISLVIVSCTKTNENKSLKFSFDKSGNYIGFSDLPLNYTIEKAKGDGYFVMQNSEIIANKNEWDNFLKVSSRKENTSIRIVKFYSKNSGSPYFSDLFYNDGYYYLFDSSAESQKEQPYSYLLTLKGRFGNPAKESSAIVLTNDSTLTFDEVMKAMLSSNTDYVKSISPFKLIMQK
jgi:hypothetical protein